MNPQFIITLFSNWQLIVISIFIMILMPIVFYLASLDRRPVKVRQNSLDTLAAKSGNLKKSAEDKNTEESKQEQNEENNSEGGKGT